MKKIILLSLLVFTFFVTGCSVDLDTSKSSVESKAERLEAIADEVRYEFDEAMNLVNKLEAKDEINSNDQKRISQQIYSLLSVINEFKELETPVIGKKVKDFVKEDLKSREEILLHVQEKAEKGTATKDDLQKMEKALSDDVNISFFN